MSMPDSSLPHRTQWVQLTRPLAMSPAINLSAALIFVCDLAAIRWAMSYALCEIVTGAAVVAGFQEQPPSLRLHNSFRTGNRAAQPVWIENQGLQP